MTAAASGAAAEVPECLVVHRPYRSVVAWWGGGKGGGEDGGPMVVGLWCGVVWEEGRGFMVVNFMVWCDFGVEMGFSGGMW